MMLFVGGSLIALACSLLWSVRKEVVLSVKSRSWRWTRGVVTKVELIMHPGLYSHMVFEHQRQTTTCQVIEYRYEVEASRYKGNRVAFDLASGNLLSFANGMEVKVFYDPIDPRSSVLCRNLPILTIPAFVMLVGGIIVCCPK
jgi:hypothetical protein